MHNDINQRVLSERKPQKPSVILANNPSEAMQEMLEIIDNLHGILDKETKALETSDTQTFIGLQEKKYLAALAYRDGTRQISERKKEFSDMSNELRERFKIRKANFGLCMEKNEKRLRTSRRVLRKLSERLTKCALNQRNKAGNICYTADGTISAGSEKSLSTGINESA